jgi:hypothetical protein
MAPFLFQRFRGRGRWCSRGGGAFVVPVLPRHGAAARGSRSGNTTMCRSRKRGATRTSRCRRSRWRSSLPCNGGGGGGGRWHNSAVRYGRCSSPLGQVSVIATAAATSNTASCCCCCCSAGSGCGRERRLAVVALKLLLLVLFQNPRSIVRPLSPHDATSSTATAVVGATHSLFFFACYVGSTLALYFLLLFLKTREPSTVPYLLLPSLPCTFVVVDVVGCEDAAAVVVVVAWNERKGSAHPRSLPHARTATTNTATVIYVYLYICTVDSIRQRQRQQQQNETFGSRFSWKNEKQQNKRV